MPKKVKTEKSKKGKSRKDNQKVMVVDDKTIENAPEQTLLDRIDPLKIDPDRVSAFKTRGFTLEDGGDFVLEEVKEKIIRVFKGASSDSDEEGSSGNSLHEPRVFFDNISKTQQEQMATAAALKILEDGNRQNAVSSALKDSPLYEKLNQRMGRKNSPGESTLADSEVVIMGKERAFAIEYSPGMVPRVAALGNNSNYVKLVQDAFKLGIPAVEVSGWDNKVFENIKVGDEIPGDSYEMVAKALAFAYQSQFEVMPLRFLKPEKESKGSIKKLAAAAKKYAGFLSMVPLSMEISEYFRDMTEDLEEYLQMAYSRFISESGLIIPPVKILISPDLKNNQYSFSIRETVYDSGTVDLSLEKTEIFYRLQERLRWLLVNFGYKLLGYLETEFIIKQVAKTAPGLVKSIFPRLTVGAYKLILQGLLKEQISIKDQISIMEVIEENMEHTSDPELLIEYIRASFSKYISNKYQDSEGVLNAIFISHETSRIIMESIKETMNVRWLEMGYHEGLEFLTSLGNEVKKVESLGIPVVLMTPPMIRRFVRNITEGSFPWLPVMSYSEIAPMTPIKTVGTIDVKKQS